MGSGYDCYNGLYGQGLARSTFSACSINFEDQPYSGQSPAYMIPNNNDDNMPTTNGVFGPLASPRNWDVFPGSTRGQGSFYTDQSTPSSTTMPSGNFSVNNVSFASHAHDGPSSVPASGTVATSMSNPDRILPNPTMSRSSHQPAFVMSVGSSMDNLPFSQTGYRHTMPWAGNDATSASSRSSDRVMSVSYASTVESNEASNIGSLTTSQDNSFGYLSMSQRSPKASLKAIASPSNPSRRDTDGRTADDLGDENDKPLSQQDSPSPNNNAAEAYGYSSETTLGSRPLRGRVSSGTLSNGQEYTRLRPLPPSIAELYDSAQPDSSDYHTQMAHRTSIPSLSTSARY
jgi:hypothetical protein